MFKIIDIPDEFEEEIHNRNDDCTTHKILSLMKIFDGDHDGLCKILKVFPHMISSIDEPSPIMKDCCDEYTLKFANNLSDSEIKLIIDTEGGFGIISFIPYVIGSNKIKMGKTLNIETALSIANEYGEIEIFNNYSDCEWYDDMVRLFKLERM